MHGARWSALWSAVQAVITGKQLWLTGIGRAWPTRCLRKHGIKAIDRLLGNRFLHNETKKIYQVLFASLLKKQDIQPVLLVDITDLTPFVSTITASLALDGRSIPIYHKVIYKKENNKPRIRKAFLKELNQLLPQSKTMKYLIVTDAGFQSPWFDEVEAMGWDYLGRVGHQTKYLLDNRWVTAKELRNLAKNRAINLGNIIFPRRKPKSRRLVLAKQRISKNRKRLNCRGKKARFPNYMHHEKRAREPWLLSTSLSCNPQQVVDLYALRMEIEQNFRDVKNHRWGWSLNHARTRCHKRWQVLLLIGTLASLIQIAAGIASEKFGLHYRHQANTIRHRRVLSLFLLGGVILNSKDHELLTPAALTKAFDCIALKLLLISQRAL
jgi:hypothetical protein